MARRLSALLMPPPPHPPLFHAATATAKAVAEAVAAAFAQSCCAGAQSAASTLSTALAQDIEQATASGWWWDGMAMAPCRQQNLAARSPWPALRLPACLPGCLPACLPACLLACLPGPSGSHPVSQAAAGSPGKCTSAAVCCAATSSACASGGGDAQAVSNAVSTAVVRLPGLSEVEEEEEEKEGRNTHRGLQLKHRPGSVSLRPAASVVAEQGVAAACKQRCCVSLLRHRDRRLSLLLQATATASAYAQALSACSSPGEPSPLFS